MSSPRKPSIKSESFMVAASESFLSQNESPINSMRKVSFHMFFSSPKGKKDNDIQLDYKDAYFDIENGVDNIASNVVDDTDKSTESCCTRLKSMLCCK